MASNLSPLVDLESGWRALAASCEKRSGTPCTFDETCDRNTGMPGANSPGESATVVFENRRVTGSIAHRGKKAASILCRGLSFNFRARDLRRTAFTGMAQPAWLVITLQRCTITLRAARPQLASTTATRMIKRSEMRSNAGHGASVYPRNDAKGRSIAR
jgi:hypothetical protein